MKIKFTSKVLIIFIFTLFYPSFVNAGTDFFECTSKESRVTKYKCFQEKMRASSSNDCRDYRNFPEIFDSCISFFNIDIDSCDYLVDELYSGKECYSWLAIKHGNMDLCIDRGSALSDCISDYVSFYNINNVSLCNKTNKDNYAHLCSLFVNYNNNYSGDCSEKEMSYFKDNCFSIHIDQIINNRVPENINIANYVEACERSESASIWRDLLPWAKGDYISNKNCLDALAIQTGNKESFCEMYKGMNEKNTFLGLGLSKYFECKYGKLVIIFLLSLLSFFVIFTIYSAKKSNSWSYIWFRKNLKIFSALGGIYFFAYFIGLAVFLDIFALFVIAPLIMILGQFSDIFEISGNDFTIQNININIFVFFFLILFFYFFSWLKYFLYKKNISKKIYWILIIMFFLIYILISTNITLKSLAGMGS